MSDENREDDDEEDQWEKEQIRKGVQITQVGKHQIRKKNENLFFLNFLIKDFCRNKTKKK